MYIYICDFSVIYIIQDLNPTLAFKIYCDARASGTLPTVDVMNNVLSMLAGLGEPGTEASMCACACIYIRCSLCKNVFFLQEVDVHEPAIPREILRLRWRYTRMRSGPICFFESRPMPR